MLVIGICGLCHHYHRDRSDGDVDSNLHAKSQVVPRLLQRGRVQSPEQPCFNILRRRPVNR
jgi:hypothetical protein